MKGDLNQFAEEKTASDKDYQQPISKGQFHTLLGFNGTMCLVSMSWNAHFEDFFSEKVYSSYSSLFCFIETNINDIPSKYFDGISDGWKGIHKSKQRSLALCFKTNKVNIIEVIDTLSVQKYCQLQETILLVVVYCMPGPLGTFVDESIPTINELPTLHRALVVGDFNLDQMFPVNVVNIETLIQNFNLSQGTH